MKLQLPDTDLSEQKPIREWLDVCTKRMLTVFGVSNLYNTLPIVYGDLGVFGTGCMFVAEDLGELFRCVAFPIGSYALGQDRRGLVTSFVREYELSVRQVVEEFGLKANGKDIDWTNISTTVKKLWDDGNYEASVELCWSIRPNEEARTDRLDANACRTPAATGRRAATSRSSCASPGSGCSRSSRRGGTSPARTPTAPTARG